MARTTEAAIRKVLDTNLTSAQIVAFLDDANLWVTEELVGTGLTDDRLELIEKYLACALIRTRDLGVKSVKVGDVSEQYQADPEVTDYLTRAASFDDTGKLRRAFLAPPERQGAVIVRVGELFKDET